MEREATRGGTGKKELCTYGPEYKDLKTLAHMGLKRCFQSVFFDSIPILRRMIRPSARQRDSHTNNISEPANNDVLDHEVTGYLSTEAFEYTPSDTYRFFYFAMSGSPPQLQV